MLVNIRIILFLQLFLPLFLIAQTSSKKLQAIRVSNAPKMDGRLDDACWQNKPIADSFVVNYPFTGNLASEKTEVKIIYDDIGIYIGAYMYDSFPNKIFKQMTKRDNTDNVDLFLIGFDTYDDNLNGYRFKITAAGVQSDERMSPNNTDINWDAVWESKVQMQNDGWSCEVKIPYSALRFPKKNIQNWGLQFARTIQRKNEVDGWAVIDPKIDGVVNQWNELTDLENIQPPVRLALLPYFTVGFRRDPISLDPKEMKNDKIISGGMDIKYGINESFTLDVTLVPDYGNVQSDNIVRNLSPFEQRYDERRPFFTEGTELFNTDDVFYSRRIGKRPGGFYDVEDDLNENERVLKNPAQAQLYNAFKLSGRTKKKLGIGLFNAITGNTYATIIDDSSGQKRKFLTEPLTNYNILVFDQALKNNSNFKFFNTSVIRNPKYRNAVVTGAITSLRGKNIKYAFDGGIVFSQIYDKQNFDKPQFGFLYSARVRKIKGNFRFKFQNYGISDKYEQNDLGILSHNNEIGYKYNVSYDEFEAKNKHLQQWNIYYGGNLTFLYKPHHYQDWSMFVGSDITFKNFWYMNVELFTKPIRSYDFYEPRTDGRYFHQIGFFVLNAYVETDQRKKFAASFNVGFAEDKRPKDPYFEIGFAPRWRVTDKITLKHDFNWNLDCGNYGYADTYNDDIIFGFRKITSVTNTFSFDYNITPTMFVTLRARHYWNKINQQRYDKLELNGELAPTDYNENNDENYNAWNLDFEYNWQFAPGSNFIVSWKNAISESDDFGGDRFTKNVRKTFNTPQSNVLTVKAIYYIDYAVLKGKIQQKRQKKEAKTAS
ncbi:MAG: DUF5916 domain-containing protein [Chitinophagales bacterium]